MEVMFVVAVEVAVVLEVRFGSGKSSNGGIEVKVEDKVARCYGL